MTISYEQIVLKKLIKKWSYSVYRGDLRDFEYWDIPNAAMASLRLFSNANKKFCATVDMWVKYSNSKTVV